MTATTDRDYLLRGVLSMVHEIVGERDPNSKGKTCPSECKVDSVIRSASIITELDYRQNIIRPVANKMKYDFDVARRLGMSIMIHIEEATKGTERPLLKSTTHEDVRLSLEAYLRDKSVAPEVRKKIYSSIASRQKRLETADTHRRRLIQLSKTHVDNRTGTYMSVSFLGEDVAGRIVELLQWRSRSSLIRSCTEFKNLQYLKRLLPHLHIRHCPGHFPHRVGYSDDSRDTWYMSKNANVTLFVDIAIEGATETSVMPPPGIDQNMVRTKNETRQVCKRSAPEEECVEGMFRRLISHRAFFVTPVECTAKLLYETGEEVLDEYGDPALKLSPESRNKGSKCTETLTMRDGSIHPARITFKLSALSNPQKQYFKIQVRTVHSTPPSTHRLELCISAHSLPHLRWCAFWKVTGTAKLKPKNEGEEGNLQNLFAESRIFMIKSHKKIADSASSKAEAKKRKLNEAARCLR